MSICSFADEERRGFSRSYETFAPLQLRGQAVHAEARRMQRMREGEMYLDVAV